MSNWPKPKPWRSSGLDDVALDLRHQNAAQFAERYWARAWAAFARGDQFTYCRLLWWLEQRLSAGDITDNQARVSFNNAYGRSLTPQQWTTLRTARIQPAASRHQATMAEGAL